KLKVFRELIWGLRVKNGVYLLVLFRTGSLAQFVHTSTGPSVSSSISSTDARSQMSNINGKVYAMNVITPMKPWKTWILRVVFWALGVYKPAQADLIQLKFIQFARWVIVPAGSFPYLGGTQKKDKLKYDYLFFFSNFNGT